MKVREQFSELILQQFAYVSGQFLGFLHRPETLEWCKKRGVSDEELDDLQKLVKKVSLTFYTDEV